jgi:hypothetical protein
MKYLKLFESFNSIDWLEFSRELALKMRSSDLDYDFSTDEFYEESDIYHSDKWIENNFKTQHIIIGGKKSFKAFPSEARQLWLIKKVADKLGGSVKMCDMGCGIGLVVKYCKKMGIDAMGVEYQKKQYQELHKKFGINVKYGDFFKMDLGFLKEQDIVYLYQPVHTKKSSLKLLKLIEENTKPDVVIIWSGMWDSIYEDLLKSDTINVYGVKRNYNDSIMAILTKNQEKA